MAFLEYIFYIPHFILGVHVYIYRGWGRGRESWSAHFLCLESYVYIIIVIWFTVVTNHHGKSEHYSN